ncbi:MAG: hypothetical protein EB121_06560 [Alphaproteobacteria bacterium]|jgi:hypothetical protein|nr:hypothetical protein [Alphaproteobacteria bacterium]
MLALGHQLIQGLTDGLFGITVGQQIAYVKGKGVGLFSRFSGRSHFNLQKMKGSCGITQASRYAIED